MAEVPGPETAWRLVHDGVELASGTGALSGLRALWRHALDRSIDDAGNPLGDLPRLELGGARLSVGRLAAGNSTLLRLRDWIHGARGPLVLDQLAQAHLRLQGEGTDPDPASASLTLLTLASILSEPEVLMRALKPGH